MMPPPTPSNPAIKPDKSPVNKKVVDNNINVKSIFFAIIMQ